MRSVMMKAIWLIWGAVWWLAGTFAFAQGAPSVSETQILEKTVLKTTGGETISVARTPKGLVMEGYTDKIVLLELFGNRCPGCKDSIPGYNRIQEKYKNDVVVIAVEVWGSDMSQMQQYAKDYHIGYRLVPKSESGQIINFAQKMTGWHPGIGVPYLMIFGKGGILVKDIAPQRLPEAYVTHIIEGLL